MSAGLAPTEEPEEPVGGTVESRWTIGRWSQHFAEQLQELAEARLQADQRSSSSNDNAFYVKRTADGDEVKVDLACLVAHCVDVDVSLTLFVWVRVQPNPNPNCLSRRTVSPSQCVSVTHAFCAASQFRYGHLMPVLQPWMRASLQRIDTDGNGEVSLDELIVIDALNQTMASVIKVLGVIFISILIANFVVSLAAAIWAQATDVAGTALVANGAGYGDDGGQIMQTAAAKESVALALSPLLDIIQLAMVEMIVVSNFFNATSACTTCSTQVVLAIDCVYKYSSTKALFISKGGTEVTVDKGQITVTKLPGQPAESEFGACAKATCSSLKVGGSVDVAKLKQQADLLGYINKGRRVFSVAKIMRLHRNAKKKIIKTEKEEKKKMGRRLLGAGRGGLPVEITNTGRRAYGLKAAAMCVGISIKH